MLKKKKLIVGLGMSLLGILCLATVLIVKNTSNASRNENIKTGESLKTINEYETASNETGVSSYIGYGYNVAKKGYIHEKNVNSSSVDNMIFNVGTSSNSDTPSIRDTSIKIDNGSRTIDKEVIDARSIDSYLKQFSFTLSEKKLDFTNGKLSWIPFVQDVYAEVGGQFSKTNLSTYKTAYITDTMIKKSASITWMLSEKEYYSYLTDNFKKDLMDMEPEDLFEKYGTHFFRSVVLGGKLQYSANIKASTDKVLDSASAAFKLNVSLKTKQTDTPSATDDANSIDNDSMIQSPATSGERNNEIKTSGNYDTDKDKISYDKVESDTNVIVECKANVYGGDANKYADTFNTIAADIANITLEKVDKNNITSNISSNYGNKSYVSPDYNSWLASVDKYPALIDIRDQYSLYAIWDLLDYFPDNDPTISEREALARKEELEEAFNEYGYYIYNKIVKKYENETEDSLYTEIETELTGVNGLSVYDKDDKLTEKEAKIHEGFMLGNVYVTNAGKTSDGKYMLNDSSFEVSYKLAQDPNNLPLDSDLYTKHKLVTDLTHVSSVNGYGKIFSFWKQYAPMKGGYYVQVIYKDNQSDSISGNNLLKNKNKGDSVVMYTSTAEEVEKHGGVEEINVLFLYKTQAISLTRSPFFKWIQKGTITFE